MKKTIILVLTCIYLFSFESYSQNVNIPDTNFKNALLANASINTTDDGEISVVEANAFAGSITTFNSNISDLTGIEAFTEIHTLLCTNNNLTSVNVSSNTKLIHLDLKYNQLTTLDVSNNPLLTGLYVEHNQITSLNIASNTVLEVLDCSVNQLTALDVSNNTALTNLTCGQNKISTLNVNTNASLIDLRCDNNQLTALDVTNNLALEVLWLFHNGITTMDLSKNGSLIVFEASGNQLSTLDVSKNIMLGSLNVHENQSITTLDVSKNINLTHLTAGFNQLTTIDVSTNTKLKTLFCNSNELTTLDVSNNTDLTKLHCGDNKFTTLDVSKNTSLQYLTCFQNQLVDLDLSNNPILLQVECFENELKTLNLQNGGDSGQGIMSDFDATDNPDLSCFYVDDVASFTDRQSTKVDYPAFTSGDCITVTSLVAKSENGLFTIDNIGNTLQLIASVEPSTATSQSAIWSVDNQEIATIDKDGLLTAVSNGIVIAKAVAAHQSDVTGEIEITIGVVSNINQSGLSKNIKIHPNPAYSSINLTLPKREMARVKLLSMDGKTVRDFGVLNTENINLNISDQKTGLYLLQIETGNQKHLKKIMLK